MVHARKKVRVDLMLGLLVPLGTEPAGRSINGRGFPARPRLDAGDLRK
jgi:hypothetical protein